MGALGLHGITVERSMGAWPRLPRPLRGDEEVSRASASVGLSYGAHSNLCVNQITRNGSDAQKRTYLPKLISGEHVGALAMSEPGAGSDVVSMRTRAEKRGRPLRAHRLEDVDHQRPHRRDPGVYAKTDPAAGPRGITLPLVEKGMKGFFTAQKLDKLACAARIPANWCSRSARSRRRTCSDRSGRGVNVLMSGLDYERAVLAAAGRSASCRPASTW